MDQDTSLSTTTAGSLATAVELSGPLPFADVLSLGADVASELSERTTGHGGVQPGSVERTGSGAWVLAAPGLALDPHAARAPELASDDQPTLAGDVYALGATLVFALTGQAFDDADFAEDPSDAAGEGSDGTAAGDAAESSPATGATAAVPQSLPDVMAMFLETLRRTLAIDPAIRVSAGELAGTLRQLRNDADRVMSAAFATSAVGAGAVAGAGADSAFAAGMVGVDGTAVVPVVAKQKTLKDRLPVMVAAAAVIVAVVAVALLLRKGDDDTNNLVAAGSGTTLTTLAPTTTIPLIVMPVGTETSTTTSTSTTTTTRPTTTVPVVIPPPPTAPPATTPPPGTQNVVVDMSNMVNCPGCLASLRSQPSLLSQLTAQFPDKTTLWGQCFTTGDTAHDDVGFTSSQWIYIVGPVSQGWVPIHLVGRQTYGLPACPQATTQPPTTKAPTTTAPTTTAPTTTTTTQAAPKK